MDVNDLFQCFYGIPNYTVFVEQFFIIVIDPIIENLLYTATTSTITTMFILIHLISFHQRACLIACSLFGLRSFCLIDDLFVIECLLCETLRCVH